jgi:hypothetical protein
MNSIHIAISKFVYYSYIFSYYLPIYSKIFQTVSYIHIFGLKLC